MPRLAELKREFNKLANQRRAKASAWFFKTGKGDYGYGDVFLGISVPQQRLLVKKYRQLPLADILRLLKSRIHEHRLTALLILADQFQRADKKGRAIIARVYIQHRRFINNWDLVDSSASYILGAYLLDRPRIILYRFAKSKNLWERRIAIITTAAFIRYNQYQDTLRIAKLLLDDDHDLIHKAVGWMLREVGNRNRPVEEKFLEMYAGRMPRTMLRYAIEKFPDKIRRGYLRMA